MMRKTGIVPVLLSSVLFIACGGGSSTGSPGGGGGSNITPINNNSAIIEGDAFGAGTVSNASLSRVVPIEVVSPNPGISFGPAYVHEEVFISTAFLLSMIPITNVSASDYCFIRIGNIDYVDATNSVLLTKPFDYIDGSSGVVASVQTSTCLAAGESGYLLLIDSSSNTAFASNTRKLRFGSINLQAGTPVTTRVQPTGYSLASDPIYTLRMQVGLQNQSAADTTLGNLPSYVILDASAVPLSWGFFDVYTSQSLPSLATTDIDLYSFFDGSANRMLVTSDYTDVIKVLPFHPGLEGMTTTQLSHLQQLTGEVRDELSRKREQFMQLQRLRD